MTEKMSSDVEDSSIELSSEQQKKIERKINRASGNLWENSKRSNNYITRIPEGQEKESSAEKVFGEIRADNFPIQLKT